MADLNPPIKAKIQQALTILEEEEFTEYIKHRIKEKLFELDLVAVDDAVIGSEVADARDQAIKLDWFMNKLREYTNE